MRKLLRLGAWLVAAAAALFLAVQLSFFARLWWWKDHDPDATAFMRARLEQMRERDPRASLKHATGIPFMR